MPQLCTSVLNDNSQTNTFHQLFSILTKEALQRIIDQFDEEDLKRKGIFGISQYGGGPDERFIRANKEGRNNLALRYIFIFISLPGNSSDLK
jgi:hypothetical protein